MTSFVKPPSKDGMIAGVTVPLASRNTCVCVCVCVRVTVIYFFSKDEHTLSVEKMFEPKNVYRQTVNYMCLFFVKINLIFLATQILFMLRSLLVTTIE